METFRNVTTTVMWIAILTNLFMAWRCWRAARETYVWIDRLKGQSVEMDKILVSRRGPLQ